MKHLLPLIFFCTCWNAHAQQKRKVLFLGNSYTQSNNLPRMVADMAASTGDTLLYDSHTPGGYTLQAHSGNATSLAKLAAGNLDYVVLQEQSQLPSFPDADVERYVFPYARLLDSIIHARNPCAETVFYMTWGRKDGDASNCAAWPPVCTYAGMDSLLSLRYRLLADRNRALLSPVGAVWQYLRQTSPGIQLYVSDGSHPSVAGTYAAACSFYTVFYRKDPERITYQAGLSGADATTIRAAARKVLFDSLRKWNIGTFDPVAAFSAAGSVNLERRFNNQSLQATSFHWDFGDGSISSERDPLHLFPSAGSYTVRLTAEHCRRQDTAAQTILIRTASDTLTENNDFTVRLFPNPARSRVMIRAGNRLRNAGFRLMDIRGRTVINGQLRGEETPLDLLSLANGNYLLQVNGSEKIVYRLLKQ